MMLSSKRDCQTVSTLWTVSLWLGCQPHSTLWSFDRVFMEVTFYNRHFQQLRPETPFKSMELRVDNFKGLIASEGQSNLKDSLGVRERCSPLFFVSPCVDMFMIPFMSNVIRTSWNKLLWNTAGDCFFSTFVGGWRQPTWLVRHYLWHPCSTHTSSSSNHLWHPCWKPPWSSSCA
jgi:hypothetical protein